VSKHGISKQDLSKKDNPQKSVMSYAIRSRKWGKFSNKDSYKSGVLKQVQFLDDIVDLVAIAGLPLCIVDHPVFMRFVRNLDRLIRLPSRRTITRHLSTKAKQVTN